ncbi:MAG: hypothetical protein M1592_01800 [Candidatus Thermoplasmatota archaeon]|nr:hypothetical protein [Candidatus Thermoplasmatota archaeon]
MNQDDIVRSIVVQGTLLESDTAYYQEMLSDQGVREYTNPVEKAIASIFRMCLDGSIDPWDIDLRSFTKIFSEVVTDEFRDFGTAGLIMYQAWHILSRKTEDSIEKRLQPEQPEYEDGEIDESVPSQLNDPVEISFNPPVRHQEKRKVFLVELLDAMREAYSNGSRARKQLAVRDPAEETHDIEEIVSNLHAEEPESEILRVGEIINSDSRSEIPLEQIWDTPEFTRPSFFVYCGFLMRERKLKLSQQQPYGPVIIEKPL